MLERKLGEGLFFLAVHPSSAFLSLSRRVATTSMSRDAAATERSSKQTTKREQHNGHQRLTPWVARRHQMAKEVIAHANWRMVYPQRMAMGLTVKFGIARAGPQVVAWTETRPHDKSDVELTQDSLRQSFTAIKKFQKLDDGVNRRLKA